MISERGKADVWVEGIGSLKTGFFPAALIDDFAATELLCTQAETKRGQVYTYQNEWHNSCYIEEEIETYTGTLVFMPNPVTEIPSMPGLVMGLQCNGEQYILSKIGWFWNDYVEVGNVRYEEGDSVEIKGVLSPYVDLLNNTYFELEIDTIR
ncbi:MAG: hypothetical protein K2M92_06440, partial [Bacteroidales bacterium]|nr:hypothetical protein [Bacteroidales bacterium]